MIRRTIKISLVILGVVIIALLAAPWFINVDHYKPRIARAIEGATGRPVTIGEIHASLFPWIGVRLKDVHLANQPGFSSRPFASIGDLDIKVALLPLFSKRVEIERFEVDGFSLSLERNAMGAENWRSLGASQGAASPGGAAGKPAPSGGGNAMLAALTAQSIHLQHGRVSWSDARGGTRVHLTDLDVQVDDVSLNQPFAFTLAGKVSGDPFSVDGKLGPIGDLANLDIGRLPLQAHVKMENLALAPYQTWLGAWPDQLGAVSQASLSVDARLEQRPDGVRVTTGQATLKASHALGLQWKLEMPDTDSVALEQAGLAIDGQHVLDASGKLGMLTTKPSYQLTLNSGELTRAWLDDLVPPLSALYAGNASAWKKIKFGAIVSGQGQRVEIRDLKLLLDGELVQASGAASLGRAPSLRLRIAADTLHADPWLPMAAAAAAPASTATDGKASAPASAKATEPDLRFLVPWDVNAQLQIEHLALKGLDFEHLRARLVGHRGKFDLNPLRFELASGQVSEHATLNVKAYPARWSESARLSGVQIGPVLKALAGSHLLEGTLRMDSDTQGTGLLPADATRSLNGRGHVLLTDGMVRGFNIAATLRSLGGALPSGTAENTDFSQLAGSYVLVNGVARNDDLFLASPLLRLTGKGRVDLVHKSLDYHVTPTLVGTLVGQGDTVTARKGLSVPLLITGPFDHPKIRPDINAKTVIQGLQKGGGLKGLLKGLTQPQAPQSAPGSAPKGTPKPAPQGQSSPQKQLQKAIEGLVPQL